MNPAPQNQTAGPSILPPESSPPTPFAYRGNGKVARLPKPVRDRLCRFMFDGLSYPDIIQRLGEHGQGLTPGHLGEFKKRGYKNWLLEQAWLAETRARQEPAAALSADFDATQLNHAALQLGTLHIFEAFRDLNSPPPSHGRGINGQGRESLEEPGEAERVPVPSPRGEGQGEGNGSELPPAASAAQVCLPNQKSKFKNQKSTLDLRLGGDSFAFVRLMNALARASRETMLVQKYRDACAQARAALTQLKDPNRKLNESETRAIVREVDQILGLDSPEDDEPVPSSSSSSSPAPPSDSPPLATAA